MAIAEAAFNPRNNDEMTNDIADWLDTVSKQETVRSVAFRRTLDGLLEG